MAHSYTFFVSMKEAKPAHGLPASKKAKKEKMASKVQVYNYAQRRRKNDKGKGTKDINRPSFT